MRRFLVTVAALLILCVYFFSGDSFGCSAVRLESFVVFNRLEGSLLRYGRVWRGGTVALYSGFNAQEQRTTPVKQVKVDANGHFDLGPIREGQYTLLAFDEQGVKTSGPLVVFSDARALHTWVLIDYRQMTPDCKEMPRWYATTLIPNKHLALNR